MRDTPRTDQMESHYTHPEDGNVDDVFWFARNLERDLNESENRVKQLENHIDRLEHCGDSFFFELTRDEAMKRWIKAKEAKP